jgi:hypothetical protein
VGKMASATPSNSAAALATSGVGPGEPPSLLPSSCRRSITSPPLASEPLPASAPTPGRGAGASPSSAPSPPTVCGCSRAGASHECKVARARASLHMMPARGGGAGCLSQGRAVGAMRIDREQLAGVERLVSQQEQLTRRDSAAASATRACGQGLRLQHLGVSFGAHQTPGPIVIARPAKAQKASLMEWAPVQCGAARVLHVHRVSRAGHAHAC